MEIKQAEQVSKTYGTPLYVYDIKELKKRINFLKSNLPNKVEICYAIKANTFIAKDIENNVDRFEVCSFGEFEICEKTEINSNKILISGVNKTKDEMDYILNNTEVNYFSIESLKQFDLFKNSDKKINLLLRLSSGNQFGINKEDIENIIINREKYPNITIKGIQYFSGTQKTSIKVLTRELEKLDNFIVELKERYNFETNELEFGTGFPVFYFEDGKEWNEKTFLTEFSNIINSLKFNGRIILEIGRSISASCGSYITKVIDTKTNKGQNYAIVDGGMNHLVYYGQSMAMKVPHTDLIPKRDNANNEKWNICGSLCTINDILIKQFNAKIEIGDIIVFKNTGAYCSTEGISLFLSRELPKVLKIYENGDIHVVRENLKTFKFNY